LIYKMFIENKNLPRVDSIIVFGVITSIKTKNSVIVKIFS